MNRKEMVDAVQSKLEVSLEAKYTKKEVAGMIESVIETIEEALAKGEEVKIAGFGNFGVREIGATSGVSKLQKDANGTAIETPWTKEAYNKPYFKASKILKEKLN